MRDQASKGEPASQDVQPHEPLAEAVSALETCAGCSQPSPRRGPNGECLRCLLGIELSAAGELLVDAAPVAVGATVGPMRYGHFEVVTGADGRPVELGSGAMATTYRAHDTVLHSAVALKVINHRVAARPGARERFLREARAAARLRHPNVASVSHYGEQDEECYYVMELVEGETLEARVRREGPLSPALTLEVGVQVARALSAAEACGVVHRDLKPSNLMLALPPGQGGSTREAFTVKVIDWGLAKAVRTDPGLGADQTRGGFVGTPAFASPEQFARGEDRRVDTRSDIYSLGVTLWYLLCGCTPFVGGTLEVIHARQEAPPLAQLATARVPKCLRTALRSMLSRDPAARPQSARELLEVLLSCQKQVADENKRRVRHDRYRPLTVASGVLAAVAVGMVLWWRPPRASETPSPDRSLAVLPFEDLGPGQTGVPFTKGLQDGITKDLAQVAALRVIGLNSLSTTGPAQNCELLSRIGGELGVRHLLGGRVRRERGRVQLEVWLWDVRDLARPWTARYERLPADALTVQSVVTREVATRMGATLTPSEQASVADPPTRDLAAYELYLRVHYGKPDFKSAAEGARYFAQVGVPLLEEAVARDPKFTLAHCKLADAYDALTQHETTTGQAEAAAKRRSQAEAALAAARRLRPDGGEVHLAQARHFRSVSHDTRQAQIELDLARRRLPDNAEVEMVAGEFAFNQNRWDEATRRFERAATLDPGSNEVRGWLVNLYASLRRYDDFDRVYAEIIATTAVRDSLAYRLNRTFSSLEARADLGPLRSAIDAVTRDEQPPAEVMERYRLVLALCAHDPDGVTSPLAETPGPSVRIRGVSYPKAWFAALAARMRQDEAGARVAFQLAREEMERVVQVNAVDGRTLSLLAMIDAGLGRQDEAVREALHACELCPVETAGDVAPVVACNLAVVYAWTGQPGAACAVLEEWIKRPAGFNLPDQPTYGDLRLNPVWDPLRGRARFEALVARLAPPAPR